MKLSRTENFTICWINKISCWGRSESCSPCVRFFLNINGSLSSCLSSGMGSFDICWKLIIMFSIAIWDILSLHLRKSSWTWSKSISSGISRSLLHRIAEVEGYNFHFGSFFRFKRHPYFRRISLLSCGCTSLSTRFSCTSRSEHDLINFVFFIQLKVIVSFWIFS